MPKHEIEELELFGRRFDAVVEYHHPQYEDDKPPKPAVASIHEVNDHGWLDPQPERSPVEQAAVEAAALYRFEADMEDRAERAYERSLDR